MLKLLKKLRLVDWLLIVLSTACIIGQVWLDLEIPGIMEEITTKIAIPGNTDLNPILIAGGKMLACAFGSLVLLIATAFIAGRVAGTLGYNLRDVIYKKVQSFSMEEISKFSTSSLITRSVNDVNQVQMFVAMGISLIIKVPTMAIMTIIKISSKGWQWSVATVSAIAIMLVVLLLVVIFAIPKFKKVQGLTDNLNRATRENVMGVRVVRAYNAEEFQQGKFDKANNDLTNNYLFTTRFMAIMGPVMNLILNGLPLAIYWIGAFLVKNAVDVADKGIIFANMITYMRFAMNLVGSFLLLAMLFMFLPRAIVSAKRINEVLGTKPKIVDGLGVTNASIPNTNQEQAEDNQNKNTTVEFKNVCFKYPDADEYIINNVSFKAKAGDTVAFIGSTGSGKSTLINLLPRFYDATEGEILLNGINVKDYTQEQLHNLIGYVPQKAVLFAGTIKENMMFGENGKPELTEDEINEALKTSMAYDFVYAKQNNLQEHVAQGGTNFSGGQKQRLAIGRAVARKPEVFIFDDSFSALDYKTDKALRAELKKVAGDSISMIVAQRIGTIIDANLIVVLDSGNVVGMGTHKQLLNNCEVYKEIALSQLSKEELGNE